MSKKRYRVEFEGGDVRFIRAFNKREAKISAQAKRIQNGRSYHNAVVREVK